MTYSQGSPGYPPGQPTTQFAAPTQQFGQIESGLSKVPLYLTIAIAALGLAVYLSSYGPMFTTTISDLPQLGSISGTSPVLSIAIIVSVLGALLAGAALALRPGLPAGYRGNHKYVGSGDRLGALPRHRVPRAAGLRRRRRAAARCGRDQPAPPATQIRPAVRPVRRPGTVLRAARPARAASGGTASAAGAATARAAAAAPGLPLAVRRRLPVRRR